jgi:predicted RecB family nuclease
VGLKAIAPLSGFGWEAGDAGGGTSMAYRALACDVDADPAVRRAAVDWLLAYNRNDVEATRRIRDWLGEPPQVLSAEIELW